MSMDQLVLFSGGPSIYSGNSPKPLQKLKSGETLIERYLNQSFVSEFDVVHICCEKKFERDFREIAESHKAYEVNVCITEDTSTTFDKFSHFLSDFTKEEVNLMFTYPDIFYVGSDFVSPKIVDKKSLALSIRPLQNRFPRVLIEPYSGVAKSISLHQGINPANPSYMYGGHLLGDASFLKDLLELFRLTNKSTRPVLEIDFLNWALGKGIVDTFLLGFDWLQCDSARDLVALLD
jgi:hypothetical protein